MKVSLHSIFSKLQTKILTEHNCYAADNIPFSDTYLQPIITQYFASNKSEIWP